MSSIQDQIITLTEKLRALMQKHNDFSKEIQQLRGEIYLLRDKQAYIETKTTVTVETETPAHEITPVIEVKKPLEPQKPRSKTDFEKFLGENLINKIGILITIIGVIIGAKYSIENELISPLTRIVLGYLCGLGLLGFGFKLKEKYEKFSAVLVSGAMCILYFLTFAAYDFYGLIPQLFAFGLMLVFTAFTVFAAITYKRQIIAHVGLVGAYAVPFLLSNNSGNVSALFSYMLIINIGILVVSFKQYWKSLYYTSFVATWLIFSCWIAFQYSAEQLFANAFIFLFAFFLIFYTTFLTYKLSKKEQFVLSDIVLLLANSFIFFGFGIELLDQNNLGYLMGAFTIANGIIHALVSGTLYKLQLVDQKLLYLIAGLVMVFITIAVPIQFDGNWVTLIWISQALLLFVLSKTKQILLFEKLAYVILALATVSLLLDWANNAPYFNPTTKESFIPFLNINFASTVFYLVGLGILVYFQQKHNETTLFEGKFHALGKALLYLVPALFVVLLYFSNYLEISDYFNYSFQKSVLPIKDSLGNSIDQGDYDIHHLRSIWIVIYSIVFCLGLSFVNIYKLKKEGLAYINLGINVLVIFVFLGLGLFALSELRESFISQESAQYYNRTVFNVVLRYISYVFVLALVFISHVYINLPFVKLNVRPAFNCLVHIFVIWVLSSELLNWLDLVGLENSYKLALSILWGIYSLFLVILGIWKKKQLLRIGGMALFGITLVKLFGYDITHLGTIAKTVVFLSLGVLLLLISFLYNKYKNTIQDEEVH